MKKTITLLTLITVAAITLTGCDLFGKNKIDITTFEKVTTDAGLLLFGGIDENTPPTLEAHRIAMSIDQSTALAFYDCTQYSLPYFSVYNTPLSKQKERLE